MIPSGYSRTVFSGALPNGEIWQTGIWANEAPSSQAATQSQADAFASKFEAYWGAAGSARTINPSSVTATRATCYSYLDATGRATHVAESSMTLAGTATSNYTPNQCAVVHTLLTAGAGRRARGRNYLPCLGASLSNGQLDNSQVSGLVGSWADFIQALNSTLGDQRVVVLSQVSGTSQVATATRVDSRLDIQRRRAKQESVAFVEVVSW